MKKLLAFLTLAVTLASCGNGIHQKLMLIQDPTAIQDTSTQHPNGVTSDGVISTDTAGFGVKANKADSTKK